MALSSYEAAWLACIITGFLAGVLACSLCAACRRAPDPFVDSWGARPRFRHIVVRHHASDCPCDVCT